MTYYAIFDKTTGLYYKYGHGHFGDMPKLYARRKDAEWRIKDMKDANVRWSWREKTDPVLVEMTVVPVGEKD